MNKIALGLVIAGVIGLAGVAAYNSNKILTTEGSNNLVGLTQNKLINSNGSNLDLNKLKFVDSKVMDIDKGKVISTKIQNDSNEKIAGAKYVYDIGGQAVIIEVNETLHPGGISELTDVRVNGNINLSDSQLLKADVKVLDDNNSISTIEYAKSV